MVQHTAPDMTAPTPAPVLPGQASDSSGYEPQHHPDNLPAPVPLHASLEYYLSEKQKSNAKFDAKKKAKTPKKTAAAPKKTPGPPQKSAHSFKNAGPSTAKRKSQTHQRGPGPSTAQDSDMFDVDLCSIDSYQGRLTISIRDYVRLADQSFLNNYLVDYFNTFLLFKAGAEVVDSVHLWNSTLYMTLSGMRMDPGSQAAQMEEQEGLSQPERRHKRVAKLTRSVDLFSKEIVLFPVCLDAEQHWVLAVALLRPQPCVMVLDSLGAVGRRREVAETVRDYLVVEQRVRRGEGLAIAILETRVPQQLDGFNCGVYVTMYVARILADPQDFSARAREDQLATWFLPCALSGQRSHWAEVIQEQTAQQNPRRGTRRFPAIQLEPTSPLPAIGSMLNLDRSCFAVSAFLLLTWCGVDGHLVQGDARTLPEQHLDNTLVDMMERRRNPATRPFSPEPFILAVNGLGKTQYLYETTFEDTPEMLQTVLEGLALQPGYLVTHRETGTCACMERCAMVSDSDH